MSKKIIEFNTSLTGNNKTRNNRSGVGEKKPKAKPVITPNSLKSKFLEKIKEHKRKETGELGSTSTSSLHSKDDELMDSMNFLSTLAKQQSQMKRKPSPPPSPHSSPRPSTVKAQSLKPNPSISTNTHHTYTAKNFSGYSGGAPLVALDLPEDLQEVQMVYEPPPQPMSTQPLHSYHHIGEGYNVDNAVPYGCLKGGLKPTYRTFTKKNRNDSISYEPSMPEPSPIQYSNITVDTSIIDRENKLNSLKEKMRKKQQDYATEQMTSQNYIQQNKETTGTPVVGPISMDISSGSTISSNEVNNPDDMVNSSTSTTSNLIKKTIKRKIVVGKSKTHPRIGVLVKDRDTRKRILHAQRDLKKKPLNDVKKYLRDHGLMKVGSNAPNDVIRKMYESSMLTGDIMNNNKEILLHNFTKTDD